MPSAVLASNPGAKMKNYKKRKANVLSESNSEFQTSGDIARQSAPSPKTSKDVAEPDNATLDPLGKKRKASVEEIEVDVTAPEPPSRKELRCVKKGKSLPGSKSDDEPQGKSDVKREEKPETEKRSEHGVWIGNLPWSTSKEQLRKFLVENSSINEDFITRVHMPGPSDFESAKGKKSGKKFHNKGFAYVDFKDAGDAQQAINLSESLLTGRRLLIKNHTSFVGRPLESSNDSMLGHGRPSNNRLFIGNLSYDATEANTVAHFERCGPVKSVKLATFEDSGKCKGYGWVVFEDLESAKNAMRGWVMLTEEDAEELRSDQEVDAKSVDDGVDDADKDVDVEGDEGIGLELNEVVAVEEGMTTDENANEDLVKMSEVKKIHGSKKEKSASKSEAKKTKPKMRKWWVNRIQGRPLRMEYAEDPQTRYKKRFGKDKTKSVTSEQAAVVEHTSKENNAPILVEKPVKPLEYRNEYAPRLTGGIVQSKGKKITF